MKREIEKRISAITLDSVCIKVNGGHEALCMMGALQFALICINPRRSKQSSPYHHVYNNHKRLRVNVHLLVVVCKLRIKE